MLDNKETCPLIDVVSNLSLLQTDAKPQYVHRSLKDVRAEIKKIEALRVLSAKPCSGSDSLTRTGSDETITVSDDEECACVEVCDDDYLPPLKTTTHVRPLKMTTLERVASRNFPLPIRHPLMMTLERVKERAAWVELFPLTNPTTGSVI